MSLASYVENIEVPEIAFERMCNSRSVLSSIEQTQFRSLIGSINWVVQGTRPDLSFELTDLSTKLREATIDDMKRALKLIKDVKFTENHILFPNLGDPVDWKIIVYTDASFANLADGFSSTYGLIAFVCGNDNSAPLSWRSGKIKRVVRSTLGAEAMALQEGLEEAYFLQNVMRGLFPRAKLPIFAVVDNKSVIEAVHSTSSVEDRRLRIDIACIKEALERGLVEKISWCPGSEQLANVLTKRGASGALLREVLQRGKLNLMV